MDLGGRPRRRKRRSARWSAADPGYFRTLLGAAPRSRPAPAPPKTAEVRQGRPRSGLLGQLPQRGLQEVAPRPDRADGQTDLGQPAPEPEDVDVERVAARRPV